MFSLNLQAFAGGEALRCDFRTVTKLMHFLVMFLYSYLVVILRGPLRIALPLYEPVSDRSADHIGNVLCFQLLMDRADRHFDRVDGNASADRDLYLREPV